MLSLELLESPEALPLHEAAHSLLFLVHSPLSVELSLLLPFASNLVRTVVLASPIELVFVVSSVDSVHEIFLLVLQLLGHPQLLIWIGVHFQVVGLGFAQASLTLIARISDDFGAVLPLHSTRVLELLLLIVSERILE